MFAEKLNDYCQKLQCTGKELAEASGLSPAVISRYRKGERTPGGQSQQLQKLCMGIAALAQKKGIADCTPDVVFASFQETQPKEADFTQCIDHLNQLISILNINITKMARFMNYDSSYLSRVRTGQRRPANFETFLDGVCSFLLHEYDAAHRAPLAKLLGCSKETVADSLSCFSALKQWLLSRAPESNSIETFLHKMDDFDLNAYIRAIHFDALKVPTLPFQLPTSKQYYGLEEMKKGELDFFKATVLSKSMAPVFMGSDMPMEDMAEDDFPKKWMFGLAMMIKKGLHLNVLHHLDRPFEELMLGLEGWIPIYMTGQISPYYLKGNYNKVFCHLNYVSGSAALTGECISGFHEKGKYLLTKNKEDVAFYQEKAKHILQKASPLMEIYRQEQAGAYHAFLLADAKEPSERKGMLSSLPLYTLPPDLLQRILHRNQIAKSEQTLIQQHAAQCRENAETILAHSKMHDQVPWFSEDEFQKYPMLLPLSGIFYEKDIPYSFEEYLAHLQCTKEFAAQHANYTLETTAIHPFRNIQITIHEGKWAMVSKSKSPAIHFVIRYAKLRNALAQMQLPILELDGAPK